MVIPGKEHLRVLYFRSRFLRRMWRWLINDTRMPPDFAQFRSSGEDQVGPLHHDEALLLFSLTRVLRPQTIVEFGFRRGNSAFNFIQAADLGCCVFSYDIDRRAEAIAQQRFGHFAAFRFIRKSQTEFSPSDIENRKIDLAFIDASHDLALNLITLDLIRPHLSDMAIIAVHDTGIWHRDFFKTRHFEYASSDFGKATGRWIDEKHYQPAVAERLFVNTVLSRYPEFAQIHLHSTNTLRNGITLLQLSKPLVVGAIANSGRADL